MSNEQLLKIENNLLNTLNLEDLEILVSDLYQKIKEQKSKKKKILPPHIRKGIKESLAAYEKGGYTTLKTKKELFDHFEKLSQ